MPFDRRLRPGLPAVVAATALALALTMTACSSSPSPEPTPTGSASPVSPPTPSPTPDLVVDPSGTAIDNLPVFTAIVDEVWNSDARAQGRAYVDALSAAGFDKAAMQLTNDLSTVGNPAESIQFSVLWGQECLLGQVGTTAPEPITIVAPALPADRCLVGVTRPIDW